jgi:hypothetical protein
MILLSSAAAVGGAIGGAVGSRFGFEGLLSLLAVIGLGVACYIGSKAWPV